MNLGDFDFELPDSLIAYKPLEKRDSSRLLVIHRKAKEIAHHSFRELPLFLSSKDLLVLNNTRVIPARLFGETVLGAKLEVLLIEKGENLLHWRCLVKPGKKVKEGLQVTFPKGVEGFLKRWNTEFEIRFSKVEEAAFYSWLSENGHVPLPPYIKRADEISDHATYQTVFAKEKGSVAAPTAGLHFTKGLLDEIKAKGVQIEEVTLHVGYGTFAPIQTENILEHPMHYETFFTSPGLIEKIRATREQGGRVIAVGTTSLRTLESLKEDLSGRTNLFIYPGYQFKNVDGLITNFHTPKSSLFVLVCALLGTKTAKEIYRQAIEEKYRFFSYGDAMLIL